MQSPLCCGQPTVAKGQRPDENHVSDTCTHPRNQKLTTC